MHNQRRPACRRAHSGMQPTVCVCVLLPSRDTHSGRARALYFQVSHAFALPASLRTPTPAIKKTNGGSIFVLELPPRDVEKDARINSLLVSEQYLSTCNQIPRS